MAATCGVGLNNAVATGVNLLGDVHGGAGQQCMQLLVELDETSSDGPDLDEAAEKVVADHRASGARIADFGHRFHPRDPRRDPLVSMVEQAVAAGVVPGWALRAPEPPWNARSPEDAARPVPMNIDGATAIVYSELWFPTELGRGLFVLARSIGVLSHASEEMSAGTRIKGPIPRPLLPDYDGPEPRDLQDHEIR